MWPHYHSPASPVGDLASRREASGDWLGVTCLLPLKPLGEKPRTNVHEPILTPAGHSALGRFTAGWDPAGGHTPASMRLYVGLDKVHRFSSRAGKPRRVRGSQMRKARKLKHWAGNWWQVSTEAVSPGFGACHLNPRSAPLAWLYSGLMTPRGAASLSARWVPKGSKELRTTQY